MSTMIFGPFKFVERLEKAGLSREQASAIVEAQKDSLSEVLDSTLATQSDLREIRSEMQAVKNNISLLDAKGAFQSDVVQYKNQIPPNPPFSKGGNENG
jgi:hypothetical protein